MRFSKIILILLYLTFVTFLFSACANKDNKNINSLYNTSNSQSPISESTSDVSSTEENQDSCSQNSGIESENSSPKENTDTNSLNNSNNDQLSTPEITKEESSSMLGEENQDVSAQSSIAKSDDTLQEYDEIAKQTIDYILYGQENPYGATSLNWDENFLNKVDINSVYQEFLAAGGTEGDIESFSDYLTKNAPILEDWQDMVKSGYLEDSGGTEEIVRFELLYDVYYQAYVIKDEVEVPEVVVNARTGYYHG